MKIQRGFLSFVLIILLTVSVFSVSGFSKSINEKTSDRRTNATVDNWFDNSLITDSKKIVSYETPVLIKAGETISFEGTTDSNAKIPILEYKTVNTKVSECILKLKIDDKEFVGSLPLLWTDKKDKYDVDSNGNELYPKQACIDDFVYSALINYSDEGKKEFNIDLVSGMHTFSLSSENQNILIKSFYLIEKPNIPSYQEYCKLHKKNEITDLYVLEGEKYSVKSDAYIRASAVKNASLKPYDTYSKKINILDGSTWSSAGQKVAWEVNISKDGLYKLGIKYLLSNNAGKNSYRSIEIDGISPFYECNEMEIATSGNSYNNYVFSAKDGTPYDFYLTKGTHLISLRVELGPLNEIYKEIQSLMENINETGSMLQKLTAGTVDENRTWDMNEYMPGTVDKILSYSKRSEEIYKKIEKISKDKVAFASNLLYVSETLKKLTDKPEQIPNRTKLLNVGDSSASKYLGNVLSSLLSNPISIDRLYIFNNVELPSANVSFLKNTEEGVKTFAKSFVSDSDTKDYSIGNKKNNELKVWINKPVQYVQVLQQLIDETYNVENKTNIKLSIMPSEQKLILSTASGTNPDLALSVGYATPFNFAIRGAAKNLLEYKDFLKVYSDEYNLESLVPLCTNNGVYGAIDSQDFYVMFYRKDTMNSLGLTIPDTWDDVRKMLPELLRYSMNFCIPIASSGGSKGFSVTAPFIYQNNGKIYSDDSLSVDYDSTNSLNGFTQMTEIFRYFGAQQTVADFYNSFRYNKTPIGIGTFSNYMQLSVAAPELTGLWEIAPVPGVKQDDGTVLRYQMADSTASMIFENTKKKNDCWKFLKWWLSYKTQLDYANNLQLTYGQEYRLNTANLKAFSELQYSKYDKEIILNQWKWQKETARHPASYMSERELSNAWINVVINGNGMAEAIDKAVLQSNREILRKMQEFGFCDKNGKVIKEYKQLTVDDLKQLLKEEEEKN